MMEGIRDDDRDDHPEERDQLYEERKENTRGRTLRLVESVGMGVTSSIRPMRMASTSKSTESALCTRAGCLGTSAADCAELDVKGVNAHFLAAFSDVLGSKHGRVGGKIRHDPAFTFMPPK